MNAALLPFARGRFLALCAILFLAGCASSRGVSPEAQREFALDELSAGRTLAQSALPAAAWPREDWWRAWNDPALDRLIETALAHNPTLAQAAARLHAAQAQAGFAEALRGPALGAMAGYSGVRLPESVVPQSRGGGETRYSSSVLAQFGWNLDLWGGERAAWESALDEAQASAIETQAARLALSTAITRSYAQLVAAWETADLAEADGQRAQELDALERERVAHGLDNELSRQQTRAETALAEERSLAARRAIAHWQRATVKLAGLGPDAALALARPTLNAASRHFAAALPDDLSIALLAHRPDVVAARLRVEAAGKGIDAAKTRFLPNIRLGALAGLAGDKNFDLFHLANLFYQFGPTITLPIFESGKLRANLAGQNARYEAAIAHYNQTVLEAIHQVAEAADTAHRIEREIARQDEARQAVARAYELIRLRYGQGLANRLQVLLVRQQALTAELGLAHLQAARMDNAIALVQALGGGFSADAKNAPAQTLSPESPRP